MKLTNDQMYLVGAGVAIALMIHAKRAAAAAAANTKQADPENWFEDMWARIHGRDLSLDGEHLAPSSFDAYGVTGQLAWSYPTGGLSESIGKTNPTLVQM